MKWFKHLSTARNDERLSELEDKCGLEGYGFYFKMLEIVAEALDASDKCEVVYSLSRWGRQVNVTSKKWLFLSQRCADVGLMIVCRCSDDALTKDYRISVKIPNILKYRDNHTKNLQATIKQDVDVYKEDKDRYKEDKSNKEINKETSAKAQSKSKKVIVKKSKITSDWEPSERCLELIEKAGVQTAFALSLRNEFIFYWQERGDERPGWDATFLGFVKRENERRPKQQNNDQLARNRANGDQDGWVGTRSMQDVINNPDF